MKQEDGEKYLRRSITYTIDIDTAGLCSLLGILPQERSSCRIRGQAFLQAQG
jgi:hypothetical protein